MKESNNTISLFKSIWTSYVRTALIPLILVELVFVGIYFVTNNWSQREMVELLKEDVQNELQQIANQESSVIQEQIKSVSNITEMYSIQMQKALRNPVEISTEDAERLSYTADGVYYTSKDRKDGGAAIFYSGIVPVGEEERAKVGRVLTQQNLMKDIEGCQPLIASIYLNTFDSLNIIFPYFDVISQYSTHADIPSYNFYYEADYEHNPEREVRWTDVYLDPAGHGWMASAIKPVYNEDFLEGVVGVDVTVSLITSSILNLDIPWDGYGLLISKDGTILALPEKGEMDWGLTELTDHIYDEAIMQDTLKPDQFNIYKNPDLSDFANEIDGSDNGFTSLQLGGQTQVASWSAVPETGWKLLVIVPEANVYSQVNHMSQELFKIGRFMIGGLILFYSVFFFILYRRSLKTSTNISQHLVEINNMVHNIGNGDYFQKESDFKVTEIQSTAQQLVAMGRQLGTANNSLLETQSRLEKSESELKALVNSIDDMIIESDENGVVKRIWTDAIIFDKSREEIIGASIMDVSEAEQGKQYIEVIKRVIETGEPEAIEYEVNAPSGKRWFQSRLARISEISKTAAVSSRDITARKEMEKSILAAKEEAEKASLAKSQFLNNMSHELRTPLNAVLGFAQLMEFDPQSNLNESQAENIREILQAGNHLLELINEVLDLAKIESGKSTMSIEPVQIKLLLDETIALIKPSADKRKIEIHNLSEDEFNAYVLADRTRLKQVLINILSNAVKYNKENGEVIVSCEEKEESIIFNISDSGWGIPTSEIQTIFEPFHRLPATSNIVEGTGIGLTVARQLIEFMGGKILVQSEEGRGSHFQIFMPKTFGIIQSQEISGVLPEEGDRPIGNGIYKILCIEDNPANLTLIENIINHFANTIIVSAPTGEKGIEMAIESKPDLIFADINLPGIDGFEVLEKLQHNPETKDIPVIAISASATENDIQKGLAAGFAEYITKPINVPKFMRMVFNYLGVRPGK